MRKTLKSITRYIWVGCSILGAAVGLTRSVHALNLPNYVSGNIVNYEQNTKFTDRHGHDIFNLIYIQSYASMPHDTVWHEAWRTSLTSGTTNVSFTDPDYVWNYVDFVMDPRDDLNPPPRLIYDHKLEDGWHYRYFLRGGSDYYPIWEYTLSSNPYAYFNVWTATNAPRLYNAHQNNAGNAIIVDWGFNSNIVDPNSPFYDANNDSYFIVYRGEVTVNGYEDIDPDRPGEDPADTISNVISWNVANINQRQLTDSASLSSGKKYVYAIQAHHDEANKNGLMSNNIYVDYTGVANYTAPSNLTADSFWVVNVPWLSFTWTDNIAYVSYDRVYRDPDVFYQVATVLMASRQPSYGATQTDYSSVSDDGRFYYLRVESYNYMYLLLGSSGIAEALSPIKAPTILGRHGGTDAMGASWDLHSFRVDPCGGEDKDPFLCFDVSITNNQSQEETIYRQDYLVKDGQNDLVWSAFSTDDVDSGTSYTLKVRSLIRDIDLYSGWSTPVVYSVD